MRYTCRTPPSTAGPPDLADLPQTSFSAFHKEVMSDVVIQVARKLAEMQKAQPSPLVEAIGYVNVEELPALKERLNNAVHSVDPEQPRFDMLDKLSSLHESKPLQAEQALVAPEQVRVVQGQGHGSTNLLQVLFGSRIPASPTARRMVGLFNKVKNGSADALGIVVRAKHLGDTLMSEMPPGGSIDKAMNKLNETLRNWSKGLSDQELLGLYRGYVDHLE